MIVIGIETSTPQTSVAIGTEDTILAEATVAGKARQEAVTPVLDHLLRWAGLDLQEVEGVAVGLGPGLFTGLRVGVETAKTLAQVLDVPILGVGSLDVLAAPVRAARRTIAAVIDGRRGEVFWAAYRSLSSGVQRMREPSVCTPNRLVEGLGTISGELVIVGNGAVLYREEISALGAKVELASPMLGHPRAAHVIELAAPLLAAGDRDDLFEITPSYLRRSDAEIAWDRRAQGLSSTD